ncbi:MAG: Glu/Leu/Phe/Val dehydrogenase dimerization domain-containing protein [Acidobacteriia bacterium]|nr:Glu/Leu/Phe/Val dehydrogenase dimerization domain-containing protein [Terriglobia bacterium]
MTIFEKLRAENCERLLAFDDESSGLRGFIAIHTLRKGRALGGIRLWNYPSEEAALDDAIKLAVTMTRKVVMADLPCGGAKCVVWNHEKLKRKPALLRLGEMIESLQGIFFAGRDLGISPVDLAILAKASEYVVNENKTGDLSFYTALGVIQGMRAVLKFVNGSDKLQGATVSLQGVGEVGSAVAKMLAKEKVKLVVTDIDRHRAQAIAKKYKATLVEPEEIFTVRSDIFSPCAVGGVLDEVHVKRLRAKAVVGAANNQLASPEMGQELLNRGIHYAPDYVTNAGAVIHGARFSLDGKKDNTKEIHRIYERVLSIASIAKRRGAPTNLIADEIVRKKMG